MDDLRNDPEFEIRWPNDLLALELDRVIAQARAVGFLSNWREEVETLLRQAFTSAVPLREFREQWNRSARKIEAYGGEEPF